MNNEDDNPHDQPQPDKKIWLVEVRGIGNQWHIIDVITEKSDLPDFQMSMRDRAIEYRFSRYARVPL